MKNNKQIIFIISAPSGCGKTSIANRLLKVDKNICQSISVTTRNKRIGELEGVDYFFKTQQQFNSMVFNNEFLEHAVVHGSSYGTPKKSVEDKLIQGFDVLFIIDIQGASMVLEKIPQKQKIVTIFISLPNKEELRRRLLLRGQNTQQEIDQRIFVGIDEENHAKNYDYIVVNNDLEVSVLEVQKIIQKEREEDNK